MSDDDFWDGTNSKTVSIEITNRKEMMAGSHIIS